MALVQHCAPVSFAAGMTPRIPGRLSQFPLSRICSDVAPRRTPRGHAWDTLTAATLQMTVLHFSALHAVRGAAVAGGLRQQHAAAPRRSRRNAVRPLAASEKDGQQQVQEVDDERTASDGSRLDSVNPLKLGRRSRQFVDDVWRRVVNLGQVGRNDDYADLVEDLGLDNPDFVSPEAQFTTVRSILCSSCAGSLRQPRCPGAIGRRHA